MKKAILSLLTAIICSLTAIADDVSWINLSKSDMQINFKNGEYQYVSTVKLRLHSRMLNCYITDWSNLNAKLNDNDVEITETDFDKNGKPTALYLRVNASVPGDYVLTFNRELKYFDTETEEIKDAFETSGIQRYNFTITDYTTLESIEKYYVKNSPHTSDIIKYLYNNPPGEYTQLLGNYGFDVNEKFAHFFRNDMSLYYAPRVLDDEGNIVAYATCLDHDRSTIFRDEDVSFKMSIDKPITEPGTYWLVYPSDGAYRYYVESATPYYDVRHFVHHKIGPYIVTGPKEGATSEPVVGEVELESAESYATDMLPDTIYGSIKNASVISVHRNDDDTYGISLTSETSNEAISSIFVVDSNRFAIVIPSSYVSAAGDYTLTISTPSEIFEAFTADGTPIEFNESDPATISFSIEQPKLPELLDFYVKSAGADAYEIEKDETVSVRLMHSDQSLGMKIFIKWNPEPAGQTTLDAGNGFTEHTGDVEISEAGRLEYYTSRGGVESPVKTINFTQRNDSQAGVSDTEYINIPAEEGLYDLRGIRAPENPQSGIYIRRTTDGQTRKVIINR